MVASNASGFIISRLVQSTAWCNVIMTMPVSSANNIMPSAMSIVFSRESELRFIAANYVNFRTNR
jgi:hypothetical protein